jgi:hypothetical protein
MDLALDRMQRVKVTMNMMCASGGPGKDSCSGDSGGMFNIIKDLLFGYHINDCFIRMGCVCLGGPLTVGNDQVG